MGTPLVIHVCMYYVVAHTRVMELSADIASVYVCNHVQPDGSCRPGLSNFIVIGRSRRVDVPPDVLALYAYQASGLCIDNFDAQFHRLALPSGNINNNWHISK